MKKDISGKTDQVRRGQGGEGAVATQGHSECTVPVPLEFWSAKKTCTMNKLHMASGEHAVWEEEGGEEDEEEEEEATECFARPEI